MEEQPVSVCSGVVEGHFSRQDGGEIQSKYKPNDQRIKEMFSREPSFDYESNVLYYT